MKSAIAVLQQRAVRALRWSRLGVLSLGLGLLATGCSTGAYPVDFFPEMHYQQSFRAQEPARLQAPLDSVPTENSWPAGSFVRQELPVNLGTGRDLRNPLSRTPQNLETGQRLFAVNCAPCHGTQGKGDGPLAQYFQAAGPQVPVDLTGARGMAWNEGQLYAIITNGQPAGWFDQPAAKMPPFQDLLTPDERWLIVMAVQQLQGR
ncbi:MAG: cytochrome c [Chloroflexi bacterium]|nr:cytochrome c [Chloroflexota bacterium]